MKTDLDVIERVIDIAASPETVYRLLTDGGTRLRLVHPAPPASEVAGHSEGRGDSEGWDHFLARLTFVAGGRQIAA